MATDDALDEHGYSKRGGLVPTESMVSVPAGSLVMPLDDPRTLKALAAALRKENQAGGT